MISCETAVGFTKKRHGYSQSLLGKMYDNAIVVFLIMLISLLNIDDRKDTFNY